MIHLFGRLLLLPALFLGLPLLAQPPAGMPPSAGRPPAVGKVYGRVLDAATRKPAEFATVAVRLQRNDSLLGGTIVRTNGDFSVENLPLAPIVVEVSFIGYAASTHQVALGPGTREVDMGNLMLEPDAQVLKEVEVTGRASQVVMKADRRVFNVDRDLSTRGGTGVDVMKNVPGVNVDGEGNVELRGGSPQILIDGRPSTITLDQLPSEEIERVEVITNPSVAFDASSTGGIINVVLKKNTKPGYFGQLQAGIGTNDRYQASGSLNVKEGRLGVNLNYNYNTSGNVTNGYTERTDLLNGQVDRRYRQDGENSSFHTMHGGRLGLDYELSNRNTISLVQSVRAMKRGGNEEQVFRTVTAGSEPVSNGRQYNTNDNQNMSLSTQLMFRRKTPKEGREWTADVNYNRWERDSYSGFNTETFSPGGGHLAFSPRVQDNEGGAFTQTFRAQFDVVDPLSERTKLEWGAMGYHTDDHTWLNVFLSTPELGQMVVDTNQTNDYWITDDVYAAYVNVNHRLNARWTMQGGVRFEGSWFEADLKGKDRTIGYKYPDGTEDLGKALFPAVYFARRWENSQRELQINFSRKIRRPRFWQIMPFVQFADSRNIRIGNPALAPEMNNMAEINHLLPIQGGNGSWLTALYGRYVENVFSAVATPLESDPDVLVNTWVNGRSSFEYGWENILRVKLAPKLVTTLSTGLEYRDMQVGRGTGLANSGFNGNGKLLVSYEWGRQWSAQVNGEYRSPMIIPQGRRLSSYGVDASVSKEFNKRWSAVLSARDIFFTRRWGNTYETAMFLQESSSQHEMRNVRFTLTWKFGEYDASMFRRRAPRSEPSMRGAEGGED